jgi:metal-dependent amidase/aminoacylase/carboxypeptidase family protein
VPVFRAALGESNVIERQPIMGGEDFSRYGRAGVPIFMFFLGTVAPERVAEEKRTGVLLPSMHSPVYAPLPEPSIRTGVLTMSLAVLNLVGK